MYSVNLYLVLIYIPVFYKNQNAIYVNRILKVIHEDNENNSKVTIVIPKFTLT